MNLTFFMNNSGQHSADMGEQFIVRAGADRPGTFVLPRSLLLLPVDGRPCHIPQTTDSRQTGGFVGGGRSGMAQRLDLRRPKERPAFRRAIFSHNSSGSIVDPPSFWCRQASSLSCASQGGCFMACWPAFRKASRQEAIRAAGILKSGDSRSISSRRGIRNTRSVEK